MPSWIPQYPGSHPETVFSATGDSDDGAGEAGNFIFQTDDDVSKVLSFYEDKAKELGMTLHTAASARPERVAAIRRQRPVPESDCDPEARGETTVNVTYGRKR